MSSTTTVASEIDAHIRKCGGPYSAWYVGIAAKPRNRLFVGHNVQQHGDAWIICDAGSEAGARAVEARFLRLGCKGGGGGGDHATQHVYAYKIRPHTRE